MKYNMKWGAAVLAVFAVLAITLGVGWRITHHPKPASVLCPAYDIGHAPIADKIEHCPPLPVTTTTQPSELAQFCSAYGLALHAGNEPAFHDAYVAAHAVPVAPWPPSRLLPNGFQPPPDTTLAEATYAAHVEQCHQQGLA
jgi:hypothetical protein